MHTTTVTRKRLGNPWQSLERPYLCVWDWVASTSKELAPSFCRSITGWCEPVLPVNEQQLLTNVSSQITGKVTQDFLNKCASEGYDVAILNVVPFARLIKRYESRQFRDYTEVQVFTRMEIGATITFESATPFNLDGPTLTESSLVAMPWFAWVLVIIFGAIVAAYTVAQIVDWLKSMTVTTQTTTTTIHQPDCTTETTTQTTTQPNFLGIIALGVIGIGGIVVLLKFLKIGERREG